jgi:hypothetical protein
VRYADAWQVVLSSEVSEQPPWLLRALLCGELVIRWNDSVRYVACRDGDYSADEGDWILLDWSTGAAMFSVVDKEQFPKLWEEVAGTSEQETDEQV